MAQTLPIELWMHICDFACTDDGFTSRSLSLTSRTLRTASLPFSLRTLSARGVLQLLSLTSYLESIPEDQRFVENLFYTATFEGEDSYQTAPPDTFAKLEEFYKPGMCDRKPGPEPEEILGNFEELVGHAVSRLLLAVSKTVRIAHIVLDTYRDFIFFPIRFERLEEFYIHGHFQASFDAYIEQLPSNPTIRRLKLTDVTLYDETTLIPSITKYAPGVTHLYYRTDSNSYSSEATNHLEKLMRPQLPSSHASPNNQADSEAPRLPFPHTLQKLILHPGRRESLGFCGTGFSSIILGRKALHTYCGRWPERIVLLKEAPFVGYESRAARDAEEAKEEWLDRVNGGVGCWSEENRTASW